VSHHDDAYTSEGDHSPTAAEKLADIELLVRRHNNPGVNVGAHRLASQILAIIEGLHRCEECGAASANGRLLCDCHEPEKACLH
jgi:hypothetical protein